MLATNEIASRPWNHHSPWRRPASTGCEKPIPVSTCAAISRQTGCRVAGMVHRDPHTLEHEAGDRGSRAGSRRTPSRPGGRRGGRTGLPGRAVGPRIIELAGRPIARRTIITRTPTISASRTVQHLLVGEVEAAVKVAPAEYRICEVGLEAEDHGACEQRQKSVEDRGVRDPGGTVAPAIVRWANSSRVPARQARCQFTPGQRRAATAAVLRDRPGDP